MIGWRRGTLLRARGGAMGLCRGEACLTRSTDVKHGNDHRCHKSQLERRGTLPRARHPVAKHPPSSPNASPALVGAALRGRPPSIDDTPTVATHIRGQDKNPPVRADAEVRPYTEVHADRPDVHPHIHVHSAGRRGSLPLHEMVSSDSSSVLCGPFGNRPQGPFRTCLMEPATPTT